MKEGFSVLNSISIHDYGAPDNMPCLFLDWKDRVNMIHVAQGKASKKTVTEVAIVDDCLFLDSFMNIEPTKSEEHQKFNILCKMFKEIKAQTIKNCIVKNTADANSNVQTAVQEEKRVKPTDSLAKYMKIAFGYTSKDAMKYLNPF